MSPESGMREAKTQEREFFGGLTSRVHVSHEWGALFCGDCGSWPDEYAARIPCKGPSWYEAKASPCLGCRCPCHRAMS